MIDRPTHDRSRSKDVLGGRGQRLHTKQEGFSQRFRQVVGGARVRRRQQLLREERVAFGAREDAIHRPAREPGAEDRLQLISQLGPPQRLELKALRLPGTLQLSQKRPQRMAAVQLVRPEGGHD